MANGQTQPRGAGALVNEFLFGQRAEDVELPGLDPLQESREARRKRLEELTTGEGLTPAQRAIQAEGTQGAEALGAATRGRVLGTRGPAQALAARSAGAQEAAGRARIASNVARGVAELGAAERARGEQLLGDALNAEQQAIRLAEQERERRKKPGLLPVLTTGAGALLGAGLSPTQPAQGAQVGAGVGSGVGSLFTR